MELQKKGWTARIRDFGFKVFDDNLFLLSSSVAYYSAVALAPFLVIILAVAALLGGDVQARITTQAFDFSPELGRMVAIIFQSLNAGAGGASYDLGSTSGLVGVGVLLFTASFVFLQLRYGLDVVYGHHEARGPVSVCERVLEKLFAMLVVLVAGVFLIVSSSVPGVLRLLFPQRDLAATAFLANLAVNVLLFWGIHFLTPSVRPGKVRALGMATLSSFFFILGNGLLGVYFHTVATSSIYGAAGTLFVFLVWAYYSAFTLFLTVELFEFVGRRRRR
jgi:membrane protein